MNSRLNKISVFGSSGSGKSTITKAIAEKLKIAPVFLDEHLLEKDWTFNPNSWKDKIDALLTTDSWIAEGNYLRAMESRVKESDVIIMLDFPVHICLFRVINRHLKYRNKVRPHVNEECVEQFNIKFLKYLKSVWDFNKKSKKVIYKRIEAFGGNNKLVILKNNKEVKEFIDNL